MPGPVVDPGSFRDPSGRVFRRDGVVYRQVDRQFADEWAALFSSGLYERLIAERLLVPHEDASLDLRIDDEAIAVIRPEQIPFISYPYEWSFSQLQDAALATLRIQAFALDAGMTLKDASAFNIQFLEGRPTLIDTLSFERREADTPWVAYRQFCEHFLAPLALMARLEIRLQGLMRSDLEGIPLDLAARLLPRRTRLSPGLAAHIHLHARAQRRHADDAAEAAAPSAPQAAARVSRTGVQALVDSLERTVRSLSWRAGGTEWADYADHTNYGEEGSKAKSRLVQDFLQDAGGATVIDLGANTGQFSALAAEIGRDVIAPDVDPAAVERHYVAVRGRNEIRIQPLLIDLMNPSPASGWALAERASIFDRLHGDVLMALALIHHLAIARNVPLPMVAAAFAAMAPHAIVEWVPKEDSQVQRLLASRPDIFPTYGMDGFRLAFEGPYEILRDAPIQGTVRRLFLLRRRA